MELILIAIAGAILAAGLVWRPYRRRRDPEEALERAALAHEQERDRDRAIEMVDRMNTR